MIKSNEPMKKRNYSPNYMSGVGGVKYSHNGTGQSLNQKYRDSSRETFEKDETIKDYFGQKTNIRRSIEYQSNVQGSDKKFLD